MNPHKWVRGHTTHDRFGTVTLNVDADVIGYHWIVRVCGKPVSQGRCWKFQDACLAARTAFNYRKCLDQHGPGIVPEFNLRKWFCDFTRMP